MSFRNYSFIIFVIGCNYSVERYNCRPRKDDMIPFPLNENRFSFVVADHLLVGQLYTNPKSDRSLLSCLKVTQCSTSEIGDEPLYNQALYRSKTAPSKCKSGLPRITRTCPEWWKQSFRLRLWSLVFGVVSSEGYIMPLHIFEVGLKVNIKVYLDVLKSVVIPRWNQVAGGRSWVWQQDSAPAHKFKDTQAWLQRECYDFVSVSHWPPSPPTWTCWTTSFGHTSSTSPTWPPTTPMPAWSPPSAEYSPSSRLRLWKRHAPSFGSVSRRWLRLKAATLNRCQLYYIIKLAKLIFSIKVLK